MEARQKRNEVQNDEGRGRQVNFLRVAKKVKGAKNSENRFAAAGWGLGAADYSPGLQHSAQWGPGRRARAPL